MSDWQPARGCIGSRLVLARGEGDHGAVVVTMFGPGDQRKTAGVQR